MTKILLLQVTDNALGEDALVPGLQRDLEHNFEPTLTTEGSKMGTLTSKGATAETISAAFLLKKGDVGQKEIRRAARENRELKIWIVDTDKNENDKYDATFAYCVLGALTYTYPYEGVEEISTELTVQIQSVDGEFDELPEYMEEFAAYGFELPGEYSGEHTHGPNDGEGPVGG